MAQQKPIVDFAGENSVQPIYKHDNPYDEE
jgi:hypothetical protein